MSDIPSISGTLNSGVTFGLVVNKEFNMTDLRNIAKMLCDLADEIEAKGPSASAPESDR